MFPVPLLTDLNEALKTTHLDDSVDLLSCVVTVLYLLIASAATAAKSYAGSVIECTTPHTYTHEWAQYAKTVCLSKGTYFVPENASLSSFPKSERMANRVTYYQWTPLYLSLSAITFLFPKIFWKRMQRPLHSITGLACVLIEKMREAKGKTREREVEEIAALIHNHLEKKRWLSHPPVATWPVYLLTKALYVATQVAQMAAMSVFLQQGSDVTWGAKLARNLWNGVDWEQSGMFPRANWCDFTIKTATGPEREQTVHCIIDINGLNEKIFLLLWLWMAALAPIAAASLIGNAVELATSGDVTNMLITKERDEDKVERRLLNTFCAEWLTTDGRLTVKYMRSVDAHATAEVTEKLFEKFKAQSERRASEMSNGCEEEELFKSY